MSKHTNHCVAALSIGIGLAFVAAATAAEPAFSNQTAAAGVSMTHSTSGFSHWDYTAGGAVGDFNRDGWQDLFVISGGNGNVRDKLFINNGDGTFTDQGASWGLLIHKGKGATVGDYNNDGWPDLYVTSAGPVSGAAPGHHKLYRNNGNNTFTEVAAAAGVNFTTAGVEDGFGCCFGDYDLDGDLDLFVAGFADNNAGNRLFRNNGNGTFTDVTAASKMFQFTGISMRSFTPRFVDYDDDGHPDLYLISDFGTSRYFRNNGDGTFTDITLSTGACQEENGMGGNVGDFNNDGKIDVYATSIHQPSIGWTGNKLYLNQGAHKFIEISMSAGVEQGGYGWGAVTVDFNHDTALDIACTNGATWCSQCVNDPTRLWMNNGAGTAFVDKAPAAGMAHTGLGRGMVNFDYDNDGDQDVVIFSNSQPIALFRNDLSGPATNWLRVFLDTGQTPGLAPQGHNARVYVTATPAGGTKTIMRLMNWGDNFESSSEQSVHFGLADAPIVSTLNVAWPDGSTKTVYDLPVNQTITISSYNCQGDLNGDGRTCQDDLGTLLSAYGTQPGQPGYHTGAGSLAAPTGVGQEDLGELLGGYGCGGCP